MSLRIRSVKHSRIGTRTSLSALSEDIAPAGCDGRCLVLLLSEFLAFACIQQPFVIGEKLCLILKGDILKRGEISAARITNSSRRQLSPARVAERQMLHILPASLADSIGGDW